MTIHWYDDWFGPGMVALWRVLWLATSKYTSLFLLQMAAYWTFVAFLTSRLPLTSTRYVAVMIAAIYCCFIPQYQMRDSLMAISWGLATLLMLQLPHLKNKAIAVAVILLLIFYGLWLRPNAAAALVPFVLALVVAVWRRISMWKAIAASILISAALFAATGFATYRVMHAAKAFPSYKLKLLDLVGISKLSGINQLPACITSHPTFNYNKTLALYTPATIDHIYWSPDALIPSPTEELNACVSKQWVTTISKYPGLYLANRADGFLYYLRIKKRFKADEYSNAFIDIDPQNPLHLTQKNSRVRNTIKEAYRIMGRACLFDPWLWLLLNICAFGFTIAKFRKSGTSALQVLACVQLSGIIFLLSQVLIYQHDQDFRYNYWLVFVIFITLGTFNANTIAGRGATAKGDSEALQ